MPIVINTALSSMEVEDNGGELENNDVLRWMDNMGLPRRARADDDEAGDQHRRFSYPYRADRTVLSILDEVLDIVREDAERDLALLSSLDKHRPSKRRGRE
eukprot:CAMPEP_0117007940 /NCGR_PEP_ID=MMETSP0472-20121206/7640_1 /TAXON_ID=693140 ORGANISM="Tiarina fusus, Strain LIS" /NCGR_SAMPLE_ID=MMETSP0472 /ASSEMBLY_ACC=CAM_ASM_000603 /LENGTH=100 /DNA_ID=CAMNT_0004709851 /DNA_START=272 /DNA_END=574 /DNA_ORIENTATION=+